MIPVEICVETPDGVTAAMAGGAGRVELCACLHVGGLTPSAGLMRFAAAQEIVARALVRPRPGLFDYSPAEIEVMLADIDAARTAGLEGVIIGACGADGRLDGETLVRLAARADGLGKTLHRAFDLTPDPFEALETAVELGFDTILTSGQSVSAADGAPLIARLVAAAAGRITLMAGSGVTPANVADLIHRTAVPMVHGACRAADTPGRGNAVSEFGFGRSPRATDTAIVAKLVVNTKRAIRSLKIQGAHHE